MTMRTANFYAGDDFEPPVKPIKPKMPKNGSGLAFVDYGHDLQHYDEEYGNYKAFVQSTHIAKQARLALCKMDLAEHYEITIGQCEVVWRTAWDDAHSEGIDQVISRFESIYDLIIEYIETS